MLNASFYVAISKIMAKLEISKSAAILYALNDGLFLNDAMSAEDHELLNLRYGRKLKEVISENQIAKENSHIPKLELERQKREQIKTSFEKLQEESKLSDLDRIFKRQLEEWDTRDLPWKIKAIAYAKKHSDLQYAKLIIAKDCDIISQKEGGNAI
jgi:hypothetical protein